MPDIERERALAAGDGMKAEMLTPGEWFANDDNEVWSDVGDIHALVADFKRESTISRGNPQADSAFLVRAKKAHDVMLRRGWMPSRNESGSMWSIQDCWGDWPLELAGFSRAGGCWSDPFIALVEADKWYAANVEDKPNDA